MASSMPIGTELALPKMVYLCHEFGIGPVLIFGRLVARYFDAQLEPKSTTSTLRGR